VRTNAASGSSCFSPNGLYSSLMSDLILGTPRINTNYKMWSSQDIQRCNQDVRFQDVLLRSSTEHLTKLGIGIDVVYDDNLRGSIRKT
jgi:hypothetical protein